ncbi:MAG: aminotransferase DegT [Candidatus Cloacimonadota bacterium]|nr:MAG: aminotransferase DegT [Candidatus Cloacimonadota bacterium]PIE77781.1 MAG: aminotransferase DegT [Candidatus Delongbacteria bacterium]
MEKIIKFIKETFKTNECIHLHEPRFIGNEKKYLNECIDSTFVSTFGKYLDMFEEKLATYVGSKYAVATVNGTSALHMSLMLAGIEEGDEVITQPITFIATCTAISYCRAKPIFLDVDLDTMGLSPRSLQQFLDKNCELKDNKCINKTTNKIIRACVPMHTFGHPCKIAEIKDICDEWNILLIEDSAESLGSLYNKKHTGTFGKLGVFSFNGNKIITSGGGGAIVTDDEVLVKKARHMIRMAKVPHLYRSIHDGIGYNYRMPNINASLIVAQMENLDKLLESKRSLAEKYKDFFSSLEVDFMVEPERTRSNYWLQAIKFKNRRERDDFLDYSNAQGVMTRPVWKLISDLEMFISCQKDDLKNAKYLEERIANIPSNPII